MLIWSVLAGFLVNLSILHIPEEHILIKEGFNTIDKTANVVEKNEGSVKFLKRIEEIN